MKKALCFFLLIFLGLFRLSSQIDTVFICNPGDEITLSTTPDLYAYRWTPPYNLDNPSIANPTANPIENVTYIVERLSATGSSDNLILNPSFDEGNDFFTSDYVFVDRIQWAGSYGVNVSAFNLNSVYFTDCPDHTSGTGPMLVIDGAPMPDQEVWCQTVLVQPNTSYGFSAWLTSVKTENPAALQFFINDEPLGATFRAGDLVCQWRQFYEIWNSDTSDIATICIVNQNENPDGNDFALDDFGMFELESISYDTTVVLISAVQAAQERRLYQPNIFTPNRDGMNDFFALLAGKGVARIEDFRIYDRWGNKVFERSNCKPNEINCRWDGRNNGTDAAAGVYMYTARINYADKLVQTIKGDVILTR